MHLKVYLSSGIIQVACPLIGNTQSHLCLMSVFISVTVILCNLELKKEKSSLEKQKKVKIKKIIIIILSANMAKSILLAACFTLT